MLMMHGRGGCTVRTLVGVHIDNQFSSFLPLQGKINLSRERLRVAVQSPPPPTLHNCIQILHIPFSFLKYRHLNAVSKLARWLN